MDAAAIAIAALVLAVGGVLVAAGLRRPRLAAPGGDPASYLRSLEEDGPTDEFDQLLEEPFISRVVRPLGSRTLRSVAGLTPRNHLEQVHHRLVLAGVASSVRAEELVTLQIVGGVAGLVLGVAYAALGEPSARIGLLMLIVLPLAGAMAPHLWLQRKADERQQAIRKDLPDTVDLMAISVEAGVGLEGAMDIVCRNFVSPLAEEFSRTLKEMELGLPRREALLNLRRRTEVTELSNFVLILTQADALGMPIGRVLRTQAADMRMKRRQWAREKAGKLPVKILFPLVLFIFPAVLVVIMGPAVAEIGDAF